MRKCGEKTLTPESLFLLANEVRQGSRHSARIKGKSHEEVPLRTISVHADPLPHFASLHNQVGIGEGINVPVKHDSFADLFRITRQFKPLDIITNKVTHQDFFVGA